MHDRSVEEFVFVTDALFGSSSEVCVEVQILAFYDVIVYVYRYTDEMLGVLYVRRCRAFFHSVLVGLGVCAVEFSCEVGVIGSDSDRPFRCEVDLDTGS